MLHPSDSDLTYYIIIYVLQNYGLKKTIPPAVRQSFENLKFYFNTLLEEMQLLLLNYLKKIMQRIFSCPLV